MSKFKRNFTENNALVYTCFILYVYRPFSIKMWRHVAFLYS